VPNYTINPPNRRVFVLIIKITNYKKTSNLISSRLDIFTLGVVDVFMNKKEDTMTSDKTIAIVTFY